MINKLTEEFIEIFDENNNPTGIIKEKKKAHQDGDYHRAVHVWIINNKNEILLQRRSEKKENNPNCLDTSCAGHIMAGETILQGAIRELKEELNVDACENEFIYITTIRRSKKTQNKEFWYIYLLKCNKTIEEYIFNDKEVSEVKYINYKKLEEMVNEKVDVLLLNGEHEEEYRKLFEFIKKNVIKTI